MPSTTQIVSEVKKYDKAIKVAVLLFTAMSLYISYRRGYYNLYLINKVAAGVAAVLLSIVLLLGALARTNKKYETWLPERKYLGMIAFFFALAHGIVSFFFLPTHFSMMRFLTTGKVPFAFGLTGVIVLLGLAFISSRKALLVMGAKQWFRAHSWGVRLAVFVTAAHVLLLKLDGWMGWYLGKSKPSADLRYLALPGLGLLVGWLMLAIGSVRILERLGPKVRLFTLIFWAVALPLIYVFTFLRGAQLY